MDEASNQPRNLSEISHLFLSSVRERQTAGAPRPVRTPPPSQSKREKSVDLTPDEFATVSRSDEPAHPGRPRVTPVSAVIASHLGPDYLDRVREYASGLCESDKRVGVIQVDAGELNVSFFERAAAEMPSEMSEGPCQVEPMDARRMNEALTELNWDVERWLVVLPNLRLGESRNLLRRIDHWTLLSTSDHEGVVAGYRAMKGLADLRRPEGAGGLVLPRLALSVVGSTDDVVRLRTYRKLHDVMTQFLGWPFSAEPRGGHAGPAVEQVVLRCSASGDKAQLAQAPQWQVVAQFLARAQMEAEASALADEPEEDEIAPERPTADEAAALKIEQLELDPIPMRPAVSIAAPIAEMPPLSPRAIEAEPMNPMRIAPVPMTAGEAEVIDLPAGNDDPASVVTAVMRSGGELLECPIRPPMCPNACLAFSRGRQMVLVAVAKQGLGDLKLIAESFHWLNQNRALIAMALPQLSIDANVSTHLMLLVDQGDLSADLMQPMLHSGNVTIKGYRKLRWGGKTGLLVEAA